MAFVRGIHRWPVNSPYKGPVTRKMFPFDDFIMRGRYGASLLSSTCDLCSILLIVIQVTYNHVIMYFHISPSQTCDDESHCTEQYIYDTAIARIGILHNMIYILQYHNTPVAYPTKHHFVTEMCTCMHISVTKWCLVDICLNHSGICEMGL